MDNYKEYTVFDDLIEGVQVINPEWKYVYVNNSVVSQGKSSKKIY